MGWISKRRAIVALAAICALAVAGVAFAYFTTTGSGEATATVGNSSAVTLHGSVAKTLYPGTSSKVSFTVDNPSEGSQHVGTIHLASVTTGASECKAEWFTMPDVSVNHTFANGSGQPVSSEGTLTMANVEESQDACQGATLTLHLTSN